MGLDRTILTALLVVFLLGLAGCGGSGDSETEPDVKVSDVAPGDEDTVCEPDCTGKSFGDDGCGGSCGNPCTPSCLTLEGGLAECGSDGCDGSCGQCPTESPFCAGGYCVDDCTANCEGRECGDDGCGGSCGICNAFENSLCSAAGQCDCEQACYGKDCGYDKCGGSCGTCECGFVCEKSRCEETDDPCAGKECGPDGCGGSCGTCTGDDSCTLDGQCQGCSPKCAGKECGNDGCGGNCGQCADGENCTNGICKAGSAGGAIGDDCGSDSDCQPPADGTCMTDMPGGYCATPDCESTADCPVGAMCIILTGDGTEETWCLDECDANSDCRDGYTCLDDPKICWYQAGSGDAEVGGACYTDADCTDAGATCYPEMYNNEPTGFVQGYCVIFGCSDGDCPAGSKCLDVGTDSTACMPICTNDSQCRKGYECDGGTCFPYCGNDADCPGGYDCEVADQICIDEDVLCSDGNPMGWCPEGLFCQDGACGQFDFECDDTTMEPNETKGAAKNVSPGGYKSVLESDMQVCAGDNDWFKVTVPAGKSGTLGIKFYHDVGDLDLCIYNSSGKLLSCRYPFEDYPANWRGYDWNDEFLSALAVNSSKTFYFKADGWYGAANDYSLYSWLTTWKDGFDCTDNFDFSVCKGCKANGQCLKDDFQANLIQFPHPDSADPYVGDGYVLEHASGYNWLRRETIMLVRYAIHEVQKKFPGTKPLALMDMCQIDGITPGFDVGDPRHPETTHDEGGNIDIAYYQTIGDYSQGQVICDANGGSTDGYFCTSVANHIVDLPRTAYFIAKLAESGRFRVAGIDKLIAPLIIEALGDLKNSGAISAALFSKAKNAMAYGDGWPFHHHHIHVSLLWWSQRGHDNEPPIGCGYRLPGDGSWEDYLEQTGQ